MFQCCECGVWTHDLLPGANVCPKCDERGQWLPGDMDFGDIYVHALEQERQHKHEPAIDPWQLDPTTYQPRVSVVSFDEPEIHIDDDTRVELPDYPESENVLDAVQALNLEADPQTATVNWDDPKVSARWGADRLLAALTNELKKSGEVPPGVDIDLDVVTTLSPTGDEPCQ